MANWCTSITYLQSKKDSPRPDFDECAVRDCCCTFGTNYGVWPRAHAPSWLRALKGTPGPARHHLKVIKHICKQTRQRQSSSCLEAALCLSNPCDVDKYAVGEGVQRGGWRGCSIGRTGAETSLRKQRHLQERHTHPQSRTYGHFRRTITRSSFGFKLKQSQRT